MTKIGKLYICDRCENTGFAGYVGGIDRSGWIDPFGKFEKLEGWEIWEGKTLCPDCAKKVSSEAQRFLEGGKVMTVREFMEMGLPGVNWVKLAKPIFDEDGKQLRFEAYTNWIQTDGDDKIPFTDLNRLIVKWIIQSRSTSFNDAGILLYTVKGE